MARLSSPDSRRSAPTHHGEQHVSGPVQESVAERRARRARMPVRASSMYARTSDAGGVPVQEGPQPVDVVGRAQPVLGQ
ncbi:hypothetical protein, partial [Streptomyces sp. NPDC001820]|uniref:hypothetical protein n=1 Tax=Streptomyces sp. NPDC001820 TaxID=3364613 RepID=UPI00369DFF14